MTPEERLARLEARFEGLDDWMKSIAKDVAALTATANVGRGALWLLLKIGAVSVVVATAVAYVAEKLHLVK